MPELDDPLADRPAADPPRRPESDRVHAELQERMERLPPGHPSSPYNDDGTRKPPPLDLSDYELPIPGDPDYHPDVRALEDDSVSDGSTDGVDNDHQPDTRAPEADRPSDGSTKEADDPEHPVNEDAADDQPTTDSEADRSPAGDDAPRISTDGSWEWKGYFLSPDEAQLADQCVSRCREAEGRDQSGEYGQRGLTPAMRRIEGQLDQGELAPETEKHVIKSSDRFKEKLAKLISDEPGAEPWELAGRTVDGVRYTFLFQDEEYATGAVGACDSLTSAGFQLYERKNAWADETKSYKGINSTWRDVDSGLLFEVQMHTAASWAAKEESHREYEIIESRTATAKEKSSARIRQDQIFARVPTPDGAVEVPTYRKEGW